MGEAADGLIRPASPGLVELLGLPGSGKSTLASALLGPARRTMQDPVAPDDVLGVGRIPLRGAPDLVLRNAVARLPDRLGGRLRPVLWREQPGDPLSTVLRTHPAFLEVVAHAPPPPGADPAHVLRWRTWPITTISTHVRLRGCVAPRRTVLIEEGLVQRANTVCAGDETLAVPYFTAQPLPDALVVLHVEPRAALERLGARPKPALLRHVGLGQDDVLADLERTARLVGTAVAILRGRGLAVLELDGTSPLQELRSRTLQLVRHRAEREGR